ncbi:MAG TPA: hypothetical protein VJ549_01185 [Geothrix sp.]|nr:hypothetical protein [Geothrix sp.]
MSNLKGSLAGQPSPSSSPVFAGLPAPAWVDAAYDPIQSVAKISWASSTSAQPDGIRLERSDCDINGTLLGNWVTLPTPSGYSTSFLDQSIQEGGRYAYRVSNLFGAKDSAPCQMNRFISIPLFAPSNFQVIATAGGLQLTWQNRSLTATQLLIQRGPGQSISADTTTIATLSPTTSAYLDPIANLGYYTYVVVAKNSTGAMPSSSVTAATLNPLGALALAATPLNAPPEVDAALRPNGNWAFASAAPFGIPSMNDPWAASIPTTPGRWSDPAIRIDRQGWPHAVYATPDPNTTGGSTLLHMWYDGAVWKSEPMVNVMLPPSPSSNLNQGWTFQLDSTGTPQLLVDHATTSDPLGWTSASLSYLHKVNGAWIEEYLDVLNPAVTNLGGIRLALDEADTPHVLIIYGQNAIDYVRTAVRVWSSTTLPTAADSAGSYGFLDGLWIDGNNGWIFEENGIVGGNGLNVIQKKDGLWQSLQALGTRPFDSNYGGAARCVISPDRTRVAILYATSMGTKLYHLTSAGWHETLVAPPTPPGSAATRWIGFDSNQKLHVLLPNGSNPDYTDFHE